jgi:hypothetical protein
MSKTVKKTSKDQKEGISISLKDSEGQMQKHRSQNGDNLESALKFFLISISVLISTNVYIHKIV